MVRQWPVSMTVRFHLFPFRTQKLSSLVPKIVGWRRPVKIGRCRLLLKNSLRAERKARSGDCLYAPLAQLVEQLTLNQWVLGSSPRWCTKADTSQEVAGCFFIAISQDIADRCTIGDENRACRSLFVPTDNKAPVGLC